MCRRKGVASLPPDVIICTSGLNGSSRADSRVTYLADAGAVHLLLHQFSLDFSLRRSSGGAPPILHMVSIFYLSRGERLGLYNHVEEGSSRRT